MQVPVLESRSTRVGGLRSPGFTFGLSGNEWRGARFDLWIPAEDGVGNEPECEGVSTAECDATLGAWYEAREGGFEGPGDAAADDVLKVRHC